MLEQCTAETFTNHFGNVKWLGLIRCIPKTWRNKLTSLQNENCDHIGNNLENCYQKFLKPLLRPPTAQKSLEQACSLNNVN